MNIQIKRTLNLLFLLGIPLLSISQKTVVDSLISESKRADLADSLKIKLFGDICWEMMGSDIDLALEYGRKELELSVKTGRKGDIAQAESDIGNIYNRKAVYDTALVHYYKALKLREALKQEQKVAGIYTNIATVYMRQSKFKEALDINFKTLKIFEQIGDTLKQAIVLGNIGNLYYELKQNDEAVTFYRKSLKYSRLAKSQITEGNVLVMLGGVQFEKGIINNILVDKRSLDSAFYYFLEAEKVLSKIKATYNLAAVYNNLGRIYTEYKDYDKAIEYYSRSLAIREKLQDNYGMGLCYLHLGRVYLMKGKYDLSKDYYFKSVPIFLEAKNYVNLKQSYGELSELFEAKKDYLSAMKYHQLYSQYTDSVYTSENASQMAEMRTKYETEKKDMELSKNKTELMLKEEETKQKNTIIFTIISLSVLLAVAGFFFYRKKQVQQKAELAAEVAAQKDLRAKSILEAEEKERIRIATDLHDGVGQLLSAAKLNLSSLESQLSLQSASQQTAFKNAMSLVDDSVKEVRAVSHNMMPNTLLKLGLGSAVKEFITKIQDTPDLKVKLEIVGLNERLEQEKETVLYRVIQEVVSNIIKHAKASELTLQLIKHDKELSIMIEDNGIGFDTARINDFEGIGLKNILSRVEYINGTVHFDSNPGRGTTVVVDVPVG